MRYDGEDAVVSTDHEALLGAPWKDRRPQLVDTETTQTSDSGELHVDDRKPRTEPDVERIYNFARQGEPA